MMSKAYCKKHDEIEPQENEGFWMCPKCSRENFLRLDKNIVDKIVEIIDNKKEINRINKGRK